ncbi:MAG: PLP-dependent transferase [Bacteriovoracaceae bacterium]|jgi:cystathionine gamma-lyase|nr:PLP-dependent transferase [Bacteriovoracaceae bacterium]
MKKKLDISSKIIHVGGEPDPTTGAIMPPIFQTSTYVQSSPGKHQGYEYSRCHNPTRTRLEECLASLENAKYSMVFASGMAATTILLHALPQGSDIVVGDDVYGGTYRLFTTIYEKIHNFHFIDTTDLKKTRETIRKIKPQLVWIESPTNPTLKITDIEKVCKIGKNHGALTLVDNTFMSPYFQRPLDLGADIVLHSMTKYINGHSDVVAGALMYKSKKLHDKLFYLHKSMGPTLSPFDSWLVIRGLKTLAVRMEAHERNAMEVAEFLEKNKYVEKTIYPGLKSHPGHLIAKKQMSGFGGMVTFYLQGGIKNSKKFLESVELFALAESLGGVESLIEHPAIMTHASVPAKNRKALGIDDNLIRLSVGIESSKDIISDLKQAFKKTFS